MYNGIEGGDVMRLTIELTGVSPSDVELFEKMSSSDLTVRVSKSGDYAKISAFGSYDSLIPVIMQATAFKSYAIKLH